ncbi:protein kinase [Candidatus Uabimicrobium sp. HlEnr_7]|uniref:protein kinase domain-containing protein n=1 Tax=Candidatus Uabimicrobium helgolandensis TaxID=3095367 RepID=UPI00355740E1
MHKRQPPSMAKTLQDVKFPQSNYDMIKELGRGGMGAVYQAHDRQLNRVVAIKVILSTTNINLKRFEREILATAALNHPNIVKIFSVFLQNKVPCMVLEYIEGKTLKDYLLKNDINVKNKITLMKKIVDTIAYAHKQKILHRDLKPSNIIMDVCGEPRIMDFGLAKLTNISRKSITKSGDVIGTPKYMSPEQAQGYTRKIDEQSDVYALGAIFYEILCGEPAVKSESALSMMHEVIYKKPLPMKGVDYDIQRVCFRALKKKKKYRYNSARELSKDLSLLEKNNHSRLSVNNPLYRSKELYERYKLPILIVSTIFILMLIINLNQTTQQNKITSLMNKINKHASNKECEQMIELANEIISIDSNFVNAYIRRGLAHKVLKNYSQAIKDFVFASKIGPKARSYYHLGCVYRIQKKYDLAKKYLTKAITLQPSMVSAYAERGLVYAKKNEVKKAEKDLIHFIKNRKKINNSSASIAHYNLGSLYQQQKKYSLAEKNLTISINLDPSNSKAHNNRGMLYALQKKYKQAISDFSNMILYFPKSNIAYYNRGHAHFKYKNYKKAINDFEKAIELGISKKLLQPYIYKARLSYSKKNNQ